MAKKLLGTSKLVELPVGKFASVNGNIVYRITPDDGRESYWFPAGILVIEKHNHLPMHDAFHSSDDQKTRGYYCDIIVKPLPKHCSNAIAMIRKMIKDNYINGLVYVDHLSTLKEYIKDNAKP